jgi:hypothetical protein
MALASDFEPRFSQTVKHGFGQALKFHIAGDQPGTFCGEIGLQLEQFGN